ncbi:hypothetical protein GCM10010436_88760 [Paractinoplanes durhamensis]
MSHYYPEAPDSPLENPSTPAGETPAPAPSDETHGPADGTAPPSPAPAFTSPSSAPASASDATEQPATGESPQSPEDSSTDATAGIVRGVGHPMGRSFGAPLRALDIPGEQPDVTQSRNGEYLTVDECREKWLGNYKWYVKNSFSVCRLEGGEFNFYEIYNDAPPRWVGKLSFRVTLLGAASKTSRTVTWEAHFDKWQETLKQLNSAVFGFYFDCTAYQTPGNGISKCPTLGEKGAIRTVSGWKRSPEFTQVISTSTLPSGQANDYKIGGFDYTFHVFNQTLGQVAPSPSAPRDEQVVIAGRCDNATYIKYAKQSRAAACGFPYAASVFHLNYNETKIRPSVAFIYQAMHNLRSLRPDATADQFVPGQLYWNESGNIMPPLSRLHPAPEGRYRQQTECRQRFGQDYTAGPNGEKRDCDEYPFNATQQNMLRVGGPANETWAVKPVNRSANRTVGNYLNRFYFEDRVLNSDKFYVDIDNAPNDCCTDEPYVPASPQSGPVMATGAVASLTGLDALSGANGVAVVGGSSYTAQGDQVVKVDNTTGEVSVVAGKPATSVSACQSGTNVIFNTSSGTRLRVVGSDGRFVYITDLCGVRRIDPGTNAVTSFFSNGNYSFRTASVAIAGQTMYVVDNWWGYLDKIDLNSGVNTRVGADRDQRYFGAVAADDKYIWMVNSNTLFQINPENGAFVNSWPVNVNGNAPSALLSVGDYLYASQYTSGDTYPTIIRITKASGASTLVTGGSLTDITGIASDGEALYVADNAGGSRIWTVTEDEPFQFDPPATRPIMGNGFVQPVTSGGALSGANGVAVVGGSSYTAQGDQVVKVDNTTGEVSVVAGKPATSVSACQSGTNVIFNTSSGTRLRVVGSDGRFVYITDLCGVRRIDPGTNAVTSFFSNGNYSFRTASVAIAGQTMYVVDNWWGYLDKIDLNSGVNTRVGGQQRYFAAIAADDNYIWMVNSDTLFQINPENGAFVNSWPVNVNGNAPSALLSVGDYLYASQYTSGDTYPTIIRITKASKDSTLITPAGITDISGIVTDGTLLYVADRSSIKSVTSIRAFLYPPAATTPVISSGSVSTLATAPEIGAANGVAVLGGASFAADGTRIVRVDNATGEVSPVAGQSATSVSSCQSGTNVIFNTSSTTPLRVVGSDGRFVYATDVCGIRRIDPGTHAVTMLALNGNFTSRTASVSIAGKWMYVVDNYWGYFNRIDLDSGVSTRIGGDQRYFAAVAADDNYIWMVNSDTLFQINPDTGAFLNSWPVNINGNAPSALLSVGGYLYAAQYGPGNAYPTLVRITKSGATAGTSTTIAGAGLVDITGINTDGNRLYVADRGGVKTVA